MNNLPVLFPEQPLLQDYRKVIKICRLVNSVTKSQMDFRPNLSADVVKTLQLQNTALFTFFADLEFLARKSEDREGNEWMLNSKLDDEWAANLFSNNIDLLATGIYKFDDILKGGFRVYRDHGKTKDLKAKCTEPIVVTLQGKPGAGKTTLALEMLCNFASQGYSSVYAVTEQSIQSLMRTIERFCVDFDRVPVGSTGESSLYRCVLADTPMSDRTRHLVKFSEFVVDVARRGTQCTHEFRNHFPDSILDALQDKWNDSDGTEFNSIVADELIKKLKATKEFFVVQHADLLENGVLTPTGHAVRAILNRGLHIVVLNKIRPTSSTSTSTTSPIGRGTSVSEGFLRHDARSLRDFLASIQGTLRDDVLPNFVPSWVSIDTITAFDVLGSRESILEARMFFEESNLPTSIMLLTEIVSLDTPTAQEILSDKVIELGERSLQITDVRESGANYMQRYLEVKKCRLGPFHRGMHPIAIKSNAVKAYRSIAILLKASGKRRRTEYNQEKEGIKGDLEFGIDGMDGPLGLNRSMRKGSVTVISGPPGAHKTAICGYFLNNFDASDSSEKRCRSVIYSFGGDRRGVLSGMQQYVHSFGNRIYEKPMDSEPPRLVIRDIAPGYLFPENFVEDLIDTLDPKSPRNSDGPITRVVFDSFDSVHSAFPIMRMDQFLWKVIFQVCWDFRVSAVVKISTLPGASPYYKNMAAQVTSMADNIIEIDSNYEMRVIESETGAHPRGKLQLQTRYWDCHYKRFREQEEPGKFPVPDDTHPGIELQVRPKPWEAKSVDLIDVIRGG